MLDGKKRLVIIVTFDPAGRPENQLFRLFLASGILLEI